MKTFKPSERLLRTSPSDACADLFVTLLAFVATAAACTSRAYAQIADGSFESGTFAGWEIEPLAGGQLQWSCSIWGILDDGETLAPNGRLHAWPINADRFPATPLLPETFDATEGRFVAVQLPGCIHEHRLSQVLTIPADAATLRWDMLYVNHHGSFVDGVQDIQVTLRSPATDAVLAGGTLFQAVAGVSPISVPTMTSFSASVSSFAGDTVRLVFDINCDIDEDPFRGIDVALDNVRFESSSGDPIPGDYDADGVADGTDNCREIANLDQSDRDGDGIGDLCDNCPREPNGSQADQDGDDIGDACEGFRDGDVYFHAIGYPIGHWLHDPKERAIVKLDPFSGRQTVFRTFLPGECCGLGNITHDPFRDALLLKLSSANPELIVVDGDAQVSTLPLDWPHNVDFWVPTGDGRLFLLGRNETNGRPLGYLDENNIVHDVLDENGGLARLPFGSPDTEDMLYDVGTDSLFLVRADDDVNGITRVLRIPLTPDGGGLRGPVSNAMLDVYLPGDDREVTMGLSAGPRGKMLAKIDTNRRSGPGAFFFTIDPVTLDLQRYGEIDDTGGRFGPGTYNSATGRAIAAFRAVGRRWEEIELRSFTGGAATEAGDLISLWNAANTPTVATRLASIGDTVNHGYRLSLSLDRVPPGGEIYGIAGEKIRLHGTAFLRSSVPGIDEWHIGIRGEGAAVAFGIEPCDESCAAALAFYGGTDEVASRSLALVDPDLVPASGPLAGSPQGPGLVDRVVLSAGIGLPRTRVNILRFWVEVTVPDDPGGEPVRLFFDDGLERSGELTFNSVAIDGAVAAAKEGVFLGELSFFVKNAELLSVPATRTFELSPAEPLRVFRLDDPEARLLFVRLADDDASDGNALYLSQGRSVVPGEFDTAADERFRANQRIAVDSLRDEPVFIQTLGTSFGGGVNSVRLDVEGKDIALESFSADRGARRITAAIRGAGFVSGSTFTLVPKAGGPEVAASSAIIVSSGRAETAFVLDGSAGLYDLRVEAPGGASDLLPAAYELEETNVGPAIEARLTGTRAFRYNRLSRVTLEYTNTGDEESAAPLFRIVAPAGTELRLASELEIQRDELLVLGIHPGGVPGRLPPGATGKIPIIFRLNRCAPCPPGEPDCEEVCDDVFRLHVFARASAPVNWDAVPSPVGVDDPTWLAARPALAARFGTTWGGFADGLAEVATRLSRRGVDAASVRELFRFAVREALDRPSSAVTGRLTDAASGAPVAGGIVVFSRGGTVAASGIADPFGDYTVDWLEAGESYEVAVADYEIASTSTGSTVLAIPAMGDVHGFNVALRPGANGAEPGCPSCDERGLPATPVIPPLEVFDPVFERALRIVNSWDPNDKEGSDDLGDPVPPDSELEYTIYFENEAGKATAPAQEIVITDLLDPSMFDLDTFEVRDTRIGELPFQFAALSHRAYDRVSGYTNAPASARFAGSDSFDVVTSFEDQGQVVEVDHSVMLGWNLDRTTGRVTWRMSSDTSEALVGVLAVNDGSGRGEGHVSFVVRPRPEIAEDSELTNEAEIRFDDNPSIRTTRWVNVVKRAFAPEVPRFPRPADGSANVDSGPLLQWESPFAVAADVFLWREGDPEPAAPTALAEKFYRANDLEDGATYRWRIVGRNERGEVSGPTWRFTVGANSAVPFIRGDANADSHFDLSDAIFVLNFLFVAGPDPVCRAAADANDDRNVDISDAIAALGTLFITGDPLPPPFPACGVPPGGGDGDCASFTPCR